MIVLRNFSNKGALVPADHYKISGRTKKFLEKDVFAQASKRRTKTKKAAEWFNTQLRKLKTIIQENPRTTRKIVNAAGMGAGAAEAGYLVGKKKAEERAIKAGGKVAKGVLAGTALLGGAAAYAASKRKDKKDDSED